jgi:hypothetical protein
MSRNHPYIGKPDYQFWKKEKAIFDGGSFDPVTHVGFEIEASDKIVTAGSCFAQHVARYMSENGYNHYVAERAHPIFSDAQAAKHNYGMFSARYGNIYTAKQLKQLLLRAYGVFEPKESVWLNGDGVYVDPYRPQVQPRGFISKGELIADRDSHLSCVRDAIEKMDVFVFTLGLTECWFDKRDGAVFPLAPGVAGGEYNENIFGFKNIKFQEYVEDLLYSLSFIREKNPNVKVILTVSPVPLNATAENKHVYVASTYSKSCLRLVAEEVSEIVENCDYFPSYEIITSNYSRGSYFAKDCRDVLSSGVDWVMSVFGKHYFASTVNQATLKVDDLGSEPDHLDEMEDLIEVLCDEESIDNK